jgi:secreted trypsin-like serine protease
VKSIKVHPDWNINSTSYDADLSILELKTQITPSDTIEPICLWNLREDPDVESGVIVGFGKSEDDSIRHEKQAKELQMPIYSDFKCFSTENPELIIISSARTFCTGTGNVTGPCKGDSGFGLFIKQNNKFYLRGIISSALFDKDFRCNFDAFAVYTNVLNFKEWIGDTVGNRVDIQIQPKVPVKNVDMECGRKKIGTGTIIGGATFNAGDYPW